MKNDLEVGHIYGVYQASLKDERLPKMIQKTMRDLELRDSCDVIILDDEEVRLGDKVDMTRDDEVLFNCREGRVEVAKSSVQNNHK